MGIILALLGAVCLAVGTDVQHRGVHATAGRRGTLGATGFRALVVNPVWVGGTALIGVSTVFQLASLLTAPLVVVQPLGVIGLVVTAWLTARRTHHPLPQRRLLGIALCILGIGAFVITAVLVGQDSTVTPGRIVAILIIEACAATVGLIVHRLTKRAVAYSLAGAVMFGFVATFAQALLHEWKTGTLGLISLVAVVGLAGALVLGSTWVQSAHAKGTSTMVLAGLTVVDPLTGVLLTGAVFGELAGAAPGAIAGMVLAGAFAVAGVFFVSHE